MTQEHASAPDLGGVPKLRSLQAKDLPPIYDNIGSTEVRHLALLATMAECSIPDFDGMTIGRMVALANAAAAVTETGGRQPVDMPEEAQGQKWGMARAAHRALVLNDLAETFADFDRTAEMAKHLAALSRPSDLTLSDAPVTIRTIIEDEPSVVYDDLAAPVVIRLAYPLTVEGVRLHEIGLRPPTFRDVRSVVDGGMSQLEMHANMAGISVGTLCALRWPDMENVAAAARHLAPELEK